MLSSFLFWMLFALSVLTFGRGCRSPPEQKMGVLSPGSLAPEEGLAEAAAA